VLKAAGVNAFRCTVWSDVRVFTTSLGLSCLNCERYTGQCASYFNVLYTHSGPHD